MAVKYNLALNRGETFAAEFQYKDSSGSPVNLSDYTIESQLRVNYTDVSSSADFTCTKTDAPNGRFILTLTPSASLSLANSCYLYDVRLTSGSFVTYLLEGKVNVSPSVTR